MAVNYKLAQNQINNFNIWNKFADEYKFEASYHPNSII